MQGRGGRRARVVRRERRGWHGFESWKRRRISRQAKHQYSELSGGWGAQFLYVGAKLPGMCMGQHPLFLS
jgi:hypothetical protein